jgi:hypothetical protein
MIRIKLLCTVLVLIGIARLMGYSQEKESEYVAPSVAAPRGKAPKMQVQLLNPGESTKQYAVIFPKKLCHSKVHLKRLGATTFVPMLRPDL